MKNVSVDNITDLVVASLGKHGDISDRQHEIMSSAVKHMHAFCKDVNLQTDEFMSVCTFMMRAGQISSDKRQELILLAEILGIEVLVDMLTNPKEDNISESTILGPFYRESPPMLPLGSSIILKHFEDAETVLVRGHVLDVSGKPIAGALMDVWGDAPNGLYENHDPEQPDYNLRGRFETDENGCFSFVALRPISNPIPSDMCAGELLNYMGQHPNRPGHMHFIIFKDGFRTLISQIYDSESEWLNEDVVFAVKQSLIGNFKKAPKGTGTDLTLDFDFVLKSRNRD